MYEANPTVLPSVDPHGPNLVSQPIPEEPAGKLSNKNPESLSDLQEGTRKSPPKKTRKVGALWQLNEAKFASTGILSKLGKVLTKVVNSNIEVVLPVELVDNLSQNYDLLTEDIVVEKRDWQTDCYQDFHFRNKNPFLTGAPLDSDAARTSSEAAIRAVLRKETQKKHPSPEQGSDVWWGGVGCGGEVR